MTERNKLSVQHTIQKWEFIVGAGEKTLIRDFFKGAKDNKHSLYNNSIAGTILSERYGCGLCTIFRCASEKSECEGCPLFYHGGKCTSEGSLYEMWVHSTYNNLEIANAILTTTKQFADENGISY